MKRTLSNRLAAVAGVLAVGGEHALARRVKDVTRLPAVLSDGDGDDLLLDMADGQLVATVNGQLVATDDGVTVGRVPALRLPDTLATRLARWAEAEAEKVPPEKRTAGRPRHPVGEAAETLLHLALRERGF